MADIINITVLEDGTLQIETDEISEPNHMSADKLLKGIEELMGGKVVIKKKPNSQNHAHMHKHNIAHQH